MDCVLFDGGNIRGNRNYIPKPGHHRGTRWAFTVADLRRELPWPSEMAVVEMEGLRVSEAPHSPPLLGLLSGGARLENEGGKLKSLLFSSLCP